MGARIVITSFGSYGDVYPYVGLALGLKARGHSPVLAMPAFYRRLAEDQGLQFRAVRPDVDPADRAMVARIMDARSGTEFLLKALLGELRESHADLDAAAADADLIVTHPVTFAGPLVAQVRRLPWASTVLAPMSFFSRHDVPVFAPLPGLKRLEAIPGMGRGLVALAKRTTRSWCEPVHALRRELGLARGGNPIFEGQHSPGCVLALFSRVLAEPQPDWPPNVRITGQIPWNGAHAQEPLPAGLETFLARGEPPVVFTLGSSAVASAGGFYDESVRAVRRLGMRAVLLTGSHVENRLKEAPGDDVLPVAAAPHAALFPRASVVVHQGGVGTLHQALRSGRPTLIVPFAHDQPDNAWRAERLGVSRTLAPGRYRAGRVARELGALLAEERYRHRAGQVAFEVGAEDGVAVACDALEALLK